MTFTELLQISTYKKLTKAYMVLLFYCVILFVVSTLGYVCDKKNGFTNGMIVGMIVSLYLWFNYGKRVSYV